MVGFSGVRREIAIHVSGDVEHSGESNCGEEERKHETSLRDAPDRSECRVENDQRKDEIGRAHV